MDWVKIMQKFCLIHIINNTFSLWITQEIVNVEGFLFTIFTAVKILICLLNVGWSFKIM